MSLSPTDNRIITCPAFWQFADEDRLPSRARCPAVQNNVFEAASIAMATKAIFVFLRTLFLYNHDLQVHDEDDYNYVLKQDAAKAANTARLFLLFALCMFDAS